MTTPFKAKIISQGRITIPEPVRKELDVDIGDHVWIGDIKKLVPEPNPKEEP